MSVTYMLVNPISIGSETITQITFREPTGKDLMEVGNPFSFGAGMVAGDGFNIDARKLGAMIGRLGGIEMIKVVRLSATDWNGCEVALLSFLGIPGAISSTSTSMPAPGGATSRT